MFSSIDLSDALTIQCGAAATYLAGRGTRAVQAARNRVAERLAQIASQGRARMMLLSEFGA